MLLISLASIAVQSKLQSFSSQGTLIRNHSVSLQHRLIAQAISDTDWSLKSFMVKKRCGWVGESNSLMLEYHDREWGVPVHDDVKHFEFLVLEGAQAGLSWSIVLNKREGYRRAFSEFDPNKVARYTEKRVQKLLLDPGIIRNRQKIEAAVRNAPAFLAIQEEFGSFDAYSWRFVGGKPKVNHWKVMNQIPATSSESDAFSKDLKNRGFTFVGSTVIYAHMQAVGMVNDHLVDCFRYREVATA